MRKQVNPIHKRRKTFYRLTTISVILLLLIGVFSTLIASESDWSYDMTKDKVFTLSDETLDLLDSVDERIRIAAVYQEGKEDKLVTRLLEQYGNESDSLEIEFIDIEREPSRLSKYNIDVAAINNMTLVIQSDIRTKMVYQTSMYYRTASGNAFDGEKQISGAIRYILSDELPLVYFTEGHNEADQNSLSKLRQLLETEAYSVQTIDLVRTGEIPADASILVMASPKKDYSSEEIILIDDFLRSGGKLLTMVDAMSTNASILDNLKGMLHGYGVDITNNFIVEEDSNSYLGDNNMYLIPSYVYHHITKELAQDKRYPVLPISMGLRTLETDETITTEPLLASSPQSWMRLDVSNSFPKKAEGDIEGPITVASSAMINNAKRGYGDGRIIVIGNSTFVYNDNLNVQANGDFFKNCINWLQGSRAKGNISPKIINADTLAIRGNQLMKLIVICAVVVPLIFFVGAFLLWLVRRNK